MAVRNIMKRSIGQRWDIYQPSKSTLFWACAGAIVATMIIGFTWGGWVTGSTSRLAAVAAGEVARGELASAICVQRFNAAPDSAQKLTEFRALGESYRRRQFIEAGGWATMPTQMSPDRLGAEGCVTTLAAQPAA